MDYRCLPPLSRVCCRPENVHIKCQQKHVPQRFEDVPVTRKQRREPGPRTYNITGTGLRGGRGRHWARGGVGGVFAERLRSLTSAFPEGVVVFSQIIVTLIQLLSVYDQCHAIS